MGEGAIPTAQAISFACAIEVLGMAPPTLKQACSTADLARTSEVIFVCASEASSPVGYNFFTGAF